MNPKQCGTQHELSGHTCNDEFNSVMNHDIIDVGELDFLVLRFKWTHMQFMHTLECGKCKIL